MSTSIKWFNDRTSTHFKEILKPNLEKRDIVVRYDEELQDSGTEPQTIANQAGVPPLIRVDNYLVVNTDVISLRLTIGETFLPQLSLTFRDSPERFKLIATSKKSFVSFFYGTLKDGYFIKQEYLITELNISPLSNEVTVYGSFWVPEFYKQYIRGFSELTSFNCIKKLCEECKLGLWTNIDDTVDSQTWIQDNCTTLEFLQKVASHAYVSEDTKLLFFIDQYDYLNVIDVTKAIQNRDIETITKHTLSGKPFASDEPNPREVILSSRKLDEDNTAPQNRDNIFPIAEWSPTYNYGSNAEELPLTINRNELKISEQPIQLESTQLQTTTDLIDHGYYYAPVWDDVHPKYASVRNEVNLKMIHYSQGDTITAAMAWPCMFLYPWMYVPVKIFYMKERTMHDEQTNTEDAETIIQNAPPFDDPSKPSDGERLDELHSGDYVIESITYDLSPDFNGDMRNMLQTVKLHRPILNPIPEIKEM